MYTKDDLARAWNEGFLAALNAVGDDNGYGNPNYPDNPYEEEA